jgi:hypothetical protein
MPSYKFEAKKSLTCDEWVLVELDTPIQNLDRITDIKVLGNSATNLTTQYRYSKDGNSWSEWKTWNSWNFTPGELTWFGFRFKSQTSWNFEGFELTWTGGELINGICTFNTRVYDENSFISPCDTSQYAYNAGLGATKIWEDMSMSVFNKYGWPIIYFKCDPVKESRDVVFKEWSLLKVRECKQLKIVVPDNDFGSGEYQFGEFDIDFADDMNIQISKEMFWAAFGTDEQPAEKDFIYFPLEGRMFRVNSMQEKKGFMRKSFWWEGTLIKWNESDSIIKSEEIQTAINDLTLNFEDVGFEQESFDEGIDLTVPQQYITRPVGKNDKVRESVNVVWEQDGIVQENLSNYYTVFSKYQYDLSFSGATATELVTYQATIDTTQSFSIMMWYKGVLRDTAAQNTWLTLFSGENTIDIMSDTDYITKVRVAGVVFDTQIPLGDWYAYYIGFNRLDNTLMLRIWERADINKKTTKMSIFFESECTIPTTLVASWKPSLLANGDMITSIRFLKHPVVSENQSILFNKLVFPNSSDAYIVDDAWKILYLEQMSPR